MKKKKPIIMTILASNIKKTRMNSGMTQFQFAEKIGVSVRHVSDIERADAFPSPEVIEMIAQYFDIPSYTLFLPDDVARKELLVSSQIKKQLDDEIESAIDRILQGIRGTKIN